MVVGQLEERSLPTPEVRGLKPVISKFYIEPLFTVNCNENTKIKKKRLVIYDCRDMGRLATEQSMSSYVRM